MIAIQKVDTSRKDEVARFIRVPYRLYRDDPVWTPALHMDIRTQLNRRKFPFYAHSDADFYLARQDGEDVGRLAVLENRRYNEWQGKREANFYFFESIPDREVACALFERAFEWARQRGLEAVVGPRGMSPVDGYGLLVDGFELPQLMAMMPHNPAYYVDFMEYLGFARKVHYLSCFADPRRLHFPERIHHIAERVQQRGTLRVQSFRSMRELRAWADRLGDAYNRSFVNNWEYYPLTERELAFVQDMLLLIADPALIKIILHGNEVVGFLAAFPDISEAIRRSGGRLFPFGLVDMFLEARRTKWIALNIVGILPEYQGLGGNALLYSELEKTARSRHFEHAALYQVAETAVQMRKDLARIEGIAYKTHWVYEKKI